VPFLETIHHFWIHALFIDVCNLFLTPLINRGSQSRENSPSHPRLNP
jgi:hypothetical protein